MQTLNLFGDTQQAAQELKSDWREVGRYLLSPEVHVYAFSIAANVLLAFFPFLLVMISFCRHVLHWPEAERAIEATLKDFFAGATGNFVWRNLMDSAQYVRSMEWVSILLLLFTANGVFLPLEVALNRAWGVKENRSIWKNQAVSMALIFTCGGLALLSGILTGASIEVWQAFTGPGGLMPGWLLWGIAKVASIPVTILILFVIYCYLPNTQIPKRLVLPRAVVVGLALEAMKWINLLIWEWLYAKFAREYGPFKNSVTIVTWSFLAGLVVLAGADWSARRARAEQRAGETRPPSHTPNQIE